MAKWALVVRNHGVSVAAASNRAVFQRADVPFWDLAANVVPVLADFGHVHQTEAMWNVAMVFSHLDVIACASTSAASTAIATRWFII